MVGFFRSILLSVALLLAGLSMATAQTSDPTAEDQARVLEAVEQFWQALSEEDYDAANARLTPSFAEVMPLEQAVATWSAYVAQGISFSQIAPRALTWYADPDGLPAGLYAAVDFRGRSEQVPVVCGYLILRLIDQGPAITRLEIGTIAADIYSQIDPERLPEMMSQLGCR